MKEKRNSDYLPPKSVDRLAEEFNLSVASIYKYVNAEWNGGKKGEQIRKRAAEIIDSHSRTAIEVAVRMQEYF